MRELTSLRRPELSATSSARRRQPGSAVGARIEAMGRLVLDYVTQHDLVEADTDCRYWSRKRQPMVSLLRSRTFSGCPFEVTARTWLRS